MRLSHPDSPRPVPAPAVLRRARHHRSPPAPWLIPPAREYLPEFPTTIVEASAGPPRSCDRSSPATKACPSLRADADRSRLLRAPTAAPPLHHPPSFELQQAARAVTDRRFAQPGPLDIPPPLQA